MWINVSKVKAPVSPKYLIRQYVTSNIHDRISTRPFLSDIEKKWIVYLLMRCVEDCHREGVIHGDLKPENFLITSWNWVVLTDFASMKPTKIPDDDPAEFQYYFDCMNRRKCYVAPERFYRRQHGISQTEMIDGAVLDPVRELELGLMSLSGNRSNTAENVSIAMELTESMDAFSLGCTIAEVLR